MNCCGTSWTTRDSCGEAAFRAVRLLRVTHAAHYDANTSKATTTGERREARRREMRTERSASDVPHSTTADSTSTPSWPEHSVRGHAQIDSRADRGRAGQPARLRRVRPGPGPRLRCLPCVFSGRTSCIGARRGVPSVHAGFDPAGEQREARRRRHAADTKYDAVLAEMIGEDSRRSVSRASKPCGKRRAASSRSAPSSSRSRP